MVAALDFEKAVSELEAKIEELRAKAGSTINIDAEVSKLQSKVDQLLAQTYSALTPWQKTLVARHPSRPHFKDYIAKLVTDFMPLAGDRFFGEDEAIVGGLGKFRGRSVVVIGHEKGHDTQTRLKHNFGMAKPEGYRKAIRLFDLASRFHLPVITLIDTSGAFPGVQAEERGQAEAIARCTQAGLRVEAPVISVIVGEGGSGGAVALATGNRVLMFEHAIYSVISPEGCASILWRTSDRAADAAEAMKLTAQELLKLNVIDRIVEEPLGGAHRKPDMAITALGNAIDQELTLLLREPVQTLKMARRQKFLNMGRNLGSIAA
jgi:acetyl-CoA carboxylase carboxyl transferase subunit alpha